jgi:hypothetical protein
MSTVTRPKAKAAGARSKRGRSSKTKKEPPLPQGKSYIDHLPEDILYKVFKMKHQLEFNPTLDILDKLRLAIDSELIESRVPIRKLLEKTGTRKQLYLDVNNFTTPNNVKGQKLVQEQLNTSKIIFHRSLGTMCELEIKFIDRVDLMVIDILHIIYQLGMTSRSNKILVDIKTQHLHHKTTCITFKTC